MTNMRSWVVGFIGFLTILYPVAVYFGIQFFEPWVLAGMLSALLMLRLIWAPDHKQWSKWLLLAGICYCALAVWNNNQLTLRFYPVLISFGLFIVFFSSLFSSQPIIERIARLQHPDLPEQGIRYTRNVTIIWSVFFMINGAISLMTAIWSSFAWWSLYNGFISYLLMAALMGLEYLVRVRTQAHVR